MAVAAVAWEVERAQLQAALTALRADSTAQARALEEGFRFDCPSLDEALAFELGRVSPDAG